ncbi:MAG: alpha/beta hydrolase family protein [Acidobacteriaceae bacterium]
MNPSPHSTRSARRIRRSIYFLAACLIFLLLLPVLFRSRTRAYLQAAAILDQLNDKPVPRLLRPIAAIPVTTKTLTIPSSVGLVQARLYTPIQSANAPGLVLIPGIHYLGMDEPRLMAFARSMAACGLRVLTPELPDSREYRIQPSDVQTIGDSVQWLQNATGRPVGLMGLSFSGGLALMAAAEPPFSNEVSFVFSVGAHDDLYRVATFYVTDADPIPNGDVERATPNNYGPWILEYEHLEDFLPAADVATIRPVFRARLYENAALEKALLARLTNAQKAEYARIIDTPHQDIALFASDKKHAAEMAAVSPDGRLAGLHVPVYLLHGRGDTLIPFAEAEWLAQDLPHGTVKELLISPLIAHVGTNTSKPGIWDEWQLLHLLAQVMERAERP